MRKPHLFLFAVILVATAFASAARAQVIAPLLEKNAVEGGYAYKWFDRTVPAPVDRAEWEVASLFARFGVLDWLTLTAEGGLWGIEYGDAPGQSYTRWVIGGAASARLYRAKRWNVTATLTYNEVYDHDNSPYRFDKRTRGWNVGVLAGTSFAFSGQHVDLWAGPMFVDDLIERYAWGIDDPLAIEPENSFGVAVGTYAVLFNYVSGFAYVLYADEPQVRVGVALRSRGGGE